jgi:hypothetical protein
LKEFLTTEGAEGAEKERNIEERIEMFKEYLRLL